MKARKDINQFKELQNEFKFMLNLDQSDDEDMIDFIGDQPIDLEKRAQKKVRIAIVSDRLNMLK